METLLVELKRYVGWSAADEAALRELYPVAAPHFSRIADEHYERILAHEDARKALVGGESRVGQLKLSLVAWMERLLTGPWDEAYFALRCRIGRVHVRIALPQHYMFGAMNIIRRELNDLVDTHYQGQPDGLRRARHAVHRILDVELAIMLHTYREDLEAQQARKERLATFGQLIGSIGHELRNPLGVIESSLYILQQRVAGDERAQKHVGRIGEQLRIANDSVESLLDMIRDRPLVREKVSLAQTAADVLVALSCPPGVHVVVAGLETLPLVDADATQMRQVLSNLLDNAIFAASPVGRVDVSGRCDGALVELVFEDSGPGVDADARRRLFEPLVTTKAKGIGLGLALVKRIVERHGGDISHAPRDGAGARFVVRLPLVAAQPIA